MARMPDLQPGSSWSDLADAFLKSRRARKLSPASIRFYEYGLAPFLAWVETRSVAPEEFGQRDLDAFVSDLQAQGKRPGRAHKTSGGELGVRTLHAYCRTIRALLVFAARSGQVEAVPVLELPKVGKPQPAYLRDDQLERVLKACATPRDRALVMFMADTALRRAETVALTWGDIEFDGRLGTVHVQHGKGDRRRSSYFSAETWKLMQAYCPADEQWPTSAVWLTQTGTPLSTHGLREILRRIGQRAGIPLRPHVLRHTSARRMLSRRMPLPAVQHALGHASSTLTADLYGSFDDSMTRDAYLVAMR